MAASSVRVVQIVEATVHGVLETTIRCAGKMVLKMGKHERVSVLQKTELETRERAKDFSSKEYWEKRYSEGGNSGSGSYNRLAAFKAAVMNEFVEEKSVSSVIEWGCGDGNQLSLMNYPKYLGLDVSETTIKKCRERFKRDTSKEFRVIDDTLKIDRQFDLSISLDVIFHLVEDDVYESYMLNLFRLQENMSAYMQRMKIPGLAPYI